MTTANGNAAATKNLLVELFVEELPPKALAKLGTAFGGAIERVLGEQGLVDPDARSLFPVGTRTGKRIEYFASPRRLAVLLTGIRAQAPSKAVRLKLMPVSVGLDPQGKPTPALMKKLAAYGDPVALAGRLESAPDGKAEALFLPLTQPGVALAEGLQKALDEAIAKLPIPKVMSYQLADGWTDVHFVRPAHGLVALHGAEVVPVRALGLASGRETRGHRFEAAKSPIVLRDADSYHAQLRDEGAVIADFDERRAEIARQLRQRASAGRVPIQDDALLDEVTALVERPNVLLCRFEREFLEVPQECLILTMKANQKYFPLLDAAGKLTHEFLVVSNVAPADPSRVVQGNERVVRPRLADAKFFFDQDRKKTLASRVEGLNKVVYHGKLGSQGERIERVRAIACQVGFRIGGDALASEADQAAQLAKADLLTDMVGEFPELQGTMGAYYARHDGLPGAIAEAIEDHYKPRFAGDVLPRNDVGLAVAIADKLETVAGLFGIGQLPTGDKDPFALRRHALGVVRMLVEKELDLELPWLLRLAVLQFPALVADAASEQLAPAGEEVLKSLVAFCYDRLAGSLREQGYAAKDVEAVMALEPAVLAEVGKRLAAVRAFAAMPEAAPLAAANKRVGNILKKSEGAAGAAGTVDPTLLVEPAEAALAEALSGVAPRADAAFEARDYTASLQALAALKAPVDAFFDGVMVNADDERLRANRLALLAQLHRAMNRVADLSRLAA